jgi:antitoxin PrlF
LRILGEAKIMLKGQVTIPVEARRKFKLEVGDYVIFKEDNGNLILTKAVLKEV